MGEHPGWRKQLHPAAWGLGPSRAGGGLLWAGEGLPDLTLCLCHFGVWRDERGWQSPMREQNVSASAAPLLLGTLGVQRGSGLSPRTCPPGPDLARGPAACMRTRGPHFSPSLG